MSPTIQFDPGRAGQPEDPSDKVSEISLGESASHLDPGSKSRSNSKVKVNAKVKSQREKRDEKKLVWLADVLRDAYLEHKKNSFSGQTGKFRFRIGFLDLKERFRKKYDDLRLNPIDFGAEDEVDLVRKLSVRWIDQVYYDEKLYMELKPEIATMFETEALVQPNTVPDMLVVGAKNDIRYFIPENMVGPDYVVPKQTLPGYVVPGEVVDITITQVVSPGLIWFQLRHLTDKINGLMDDLEKFYCDRTKDALTIRTVKRNLTGMLVAALYMEEANGARRKSYGWHRAFINQIHDMSTVSVFYVDYGTSDIVSLENCRFLHTNFAKFPLQALKCRMAGVWPFRKDKDHSVGWSQQSLSAIQGWAVATNTDNGGVVARLVSEPTDRCLSMILYDTWTNNDAPNGINMNKYLIDNCYASVRPDDLRKDGTLPWERPKSTKESQLQVIEEVDIKPVEQVDIKVVDQADIKSVGQADINQNKTMSEKWVLVNKPTSESTSNLTSNVTSNPNSTSATGFKIEGLAKFWQNLTNSSQSPKPSPGRESNPRPPQPLNESSSNRCTTTELTESVETDERSCVVKVEAWLNGNSNFFPGGKDFVKDQESNHGPSEKSEEIDAKPLKPGTFRKPV